MTYDYSAPPLCGNGQFIDRRYENFQLCAVEAIEGSLWIPWTHWQDLKVPGPEGKRAHAILFSDGRVWDASNGFRAYSGRDMTEYLKTWERVKELKLRQTNRELALEVERLEKYVGPL